MHFSIVSHCAPSTVLSDAVVCPEETPAQAMADYEDGGGDGCALSTIHLSALYSRLARCSCSLVADMTTSRWTSSSQRCVHASARVCGVCACVGKRKGCCCLPPRRKTNSARTLTPCDRPAQMDEDVVADEDGDGGPQGGVDVLMGDGDGGAPGGAPNGACSSPCAAKQGYHFS